MVFLIECLVCIVIFTVMVVSLCNSDPLNFLPNFPPKLVERLKDLGIVKDEKKSKSAYIRKGVACIIIVIVLSYILIRINKADTFLKGFLLSYGLWLVVDWYDALVLDCLWFCHNKKVRFKGTEDLIDEYQNYSFHIMQSVKGMLLGLPLCLIIGLIVNFFGK